MNNFFSSITAFTHYLVEPVIKKGDIVVDATAGNGNDTLFLAQKVGPEGKVFAFDIQEEAIFRTRELLKGNNALEQVVLLQTGHENILKNVCEQVTGVMFNLGYLPKGDHSLITLPETTLLGIQQALKILKTGGVITITVYTGHQGGETEAKCIEDMVSKLAKKEWDVLKWHFLNRATAPYLIVLFKREV